MKSEEGFYEHRCANHFDYLRDALVRAGNVCLSGCARAAQQMMELVIPRGYSKTTMIYGQLLELGFLRGLYLGEIIDGMRELERPPRIPRPPLYRHPVDLMVPPHLWDDDYIFELRCKGVDNDGL